MTVVSSQKNVEALTLTFVADFDASPERVWQVWEDPRQLERWWGPPTWPATFERHHLAPGGESRYFMTGPEGDKSHGWWRVTSTDAPTRLEFEDGFAHENGEPNNDMPTVRVVVTFAATGDGTRMTSVTSFDTAEQLEQLIEMGMDEGMRLAMGQIDEILAGTAAELK
jgi:uncharacterized protein YndB with AHSA1/START domain